MTFWIDSSRILLFFFSPSLIKLTNQLFNINDISIFVFCIIIFSSFVNSFTFDFLIKSFSVVFIFSDISFFKYSLSNN